jgi:TRAP-type mannitol/chloroaromatic compound transport system substrate-binding protein
MGNLSSLKLVAQRTPSKITPVVHRRNKLMGKLKDQIALARAAAEGASFQAHRQRTTVDAETGLRRSVSVPRRIRPWWFMADNGKTAVSVRYGATVLELSKGRFAIELADASELVSALETVSAAVQAGELDAAIEAAAVKLRDRFQA